jgi:hypothetical protein
MALIVNDRVRETTTGTGTGNIALGGAVTGYQAFSTIGNGNTTYYTIAGGSQWEVGIGTYTSSGNVLARTTVLSSSNGGALVNFSAGTKDVFVTYPAEKSVNQDAVGNVGIGTITPAYKLDVSGVIRGTSDALLNGVTAGRGSGNINTNTVFGFGAFQTNTTGNTNTAVGYLSLQVNTTGFANTAIGNASMQANTTGFSNTAVGYYALPANTTGTSNIAIGVQALNSNTTGFNNTAVGNNAMNANTTGNNNSAFGGGSLNQNTTAVGNSAFGVNALSQNTTGAQNAAFGLGALYLNTTGNFNTGVGYQSLVNNTTGTNNTALGWQAGYTNSVGINNVLIGTQAGYSTTGSFNVFIGSNSGNLITGSNNSVLGAFSGNSGGLDIRTLSNYIVLSDGAGSPKQMLDSSGNANILGSLRIGSVTGVNGFVFYSPTAASLRFGGADSAAPVAQTLGVQNVVAGTLNTAGANLTIKGSQGTGTGVGGSIIFQVAPAGASGTAQNTLTSALTLSGVDKSAAFSGLITVPNTTFALVRNDATTTGYGFFAGQPAILTGASLSCVGNNQGIWTGVFTVGGSYSTGNVTLTSPIANKLQYGSFDSPTPVAQTIGVQNVNAGTLNTAGSNFTIDGSQGTGTGVGGNIIFQVAPAGASGTSQNALATSLTLSGTDKSALFAGQVQASATLWTSQLQIGGTAAAPYSIVSATVSGKFQFGGPDAAVPVPQRFGPQSVVAGTLNTQGAVFVINGSQSTGNQPGGDIVFQVAPSGASGTTQNPLTTSVRLYSNKTVLLGASYTVAALPTGLSASQGARTWVTDAASATYSVGSTLTGGGTNVIPVFYNGTAWVAG